VDGIRFLEQDGQRQTCRLGTGEPCEPEWQAQYVSDTIINPDLVGDAAANRLRRDAAAAIAPTVLEDASFAGQPAQCVRITVPGGEVQYCVLSTGLLARVVDSDLTIDLVTYQPTADETAFSPT
jgi:hypothetical protein